MGLSIAPLQAIHSYTNGIQGAVPRVLSPIQIDPYDAEDTTGYYSLIPYFGGKQRQLARILPYIAKVAQLNQAHTFIECFGGGGRCILNLNKIGYTFTTAIYNELDRSLCDLFSIVSEENTAKELMEILINTEYSKENFEYCKLHRNDMSLSSIQRASMVVILCRQSMNSDAKYFKSKTYDINAENKFYNNIQKIEQAPRRLNGIGIVNEDYKSIMSLYGSNPLVVKYLDPPYHPVCRNQQALKVYPNELSVDQHKEMVNILCNSRSWVLSGYDPAQYGCDDYKPLEDFGAIKESIGDFGVVSSNKGIIKEEFIWYKP